MSPPALIVATMVSFVAFFAHAQEISPDALVRAYPDQIAGHDDTGIILRDGTRQNLSDGKTDKSFDEKLKNGSLIDQLSLPYPKGVLTKPPGPQDDPGASATPPSSTKCMGIATKAKRRSI